MNQASPGRRGLLRTALCAAAVVAAFAAPAAYAASTSTDPDMPTFVPNAAIVGQGDIQVETGITHAQAGSGLTLLRTWGTPTLLRFGMPNNYEFRVQSNIYSRVRTNALVGNGVGDMTIGLKANVPQTMSRDLTLAVVLQAGLPSGSTQVKNGITGVRPEGLFMGTWRLPNSSSLGGVIGLRSDVDMNNERFKSGLIGGNLGHTWNPKVSSYTELTVAPWRNERRGGRNVIWDFGSAWRPMPATQINGTVGFGVTKNDTKLAWTLGVTRGFHPPAIGAYSQNHKSKTPSETPSASTEDGK